MLGKYAKAHALFLKELPLEINNGMTCIVYAYILAHTYNNKYTGSDHPRPTLQSITVNRIKQFVIRIKMTPTSRMQSRWNVCLWTYFFLLWYIQTHDIHHRILTKTKQHKAIQQEMVIVAVMVICIQMDIGRQRALKRGEKVFIDDGFDMIWMMRTNWSFAYDEWKNYIDNKR